MIEHLLSDAEFWVLLAVAIFIIVVWKPIRRNVVSTLDGRVSSTTSFIASSPAFTAACGLPGCVAGISFRPGALTPRKSSVIAIVLAV